MENTFWQLYQLPAVEHDIGTQPSEIVEATSRAEATYLESIGGIALDMDAANITAWNHFCHDALINSL